jgi:phosphoglycerate dehydrogenase-like enzyme
VIGEYDGLAIRSATKVTEKVIAAATNLKVIGRAGIGVDNVDIPEASKKGIIVMNTPFGNSITTAEHAIAMMFAVARQIPEANASTHAGKWEKSRFMGVELTGKTLGVIGAGNIGSIVIARALGLRMKVLAYDPFLSEERARRSARRRWSSRSFWRRPISSRCTCPSPRRPRTSCRRRTSPRPRRACASSTARAAVWSTRRRWPSC